MKVEITLDRVDGSKSVSKTLSLDGTGLSQLSFMLASKDVIGCTISKKDALKYIKQLNVYPVKVRRVERTDQIVADDEDVTV